MKDIDSILQQVKILRTCGIIRAYRFNDGKVL